MGGPMGLQQSRQRRAGGGEEEEEEQRQQLEERHGEDEGRGCVGFQQSEGGQQQRIPLDQRQVPKEDPKALIFSINHVLI
ncbi:hypothetical protein MUK42_18482 [Musa troglodytarum]|uniref:Uncharacterized protein n=1 Tax=Musa troglodytarum TaxID=320322 RepID=A0A9E7FWZ2_9LILI|nr:hypothetical protein MUK42_18482 [Musa troglodytarum]